MELKMICTKCNGKRVAQVIAKCSDCCHIYMEDLKDPDNYPGYNGYVPSDMGIVDEDWQTGDYVSFHWCLDCGQIQGKFPVLAREVFKSEDEEEY
jgi:hypothetical protein